MPARRRSAALDDRVVQLIAEANRHDVSAQLRIGLTSELVRAAAPEHLSSSLGRYETGLRSVVAALEAMRPRPRAQGPRRCIIYLPVPPQGGAEQGGCARRRLVAHQYQVRAAGIHLREADRLYWQAAMLAAPTLLTASRLRQLGGEREDAYQEGIAALDTAARRYDPAEGQWRRHAISWLMKLCRDRAVKLAQGSLTTYGYEVRSKARRVLAEAQAAGITLSLEVLAQQVRSTPDYLAKVLVARPPELTLDAPIGDGETGQRQGELLADEQATQQQESQEVALDVEAVLAKMPAREAWVTARVAGLWGTDPVRESELATEMRCPEEDVDRLRRRAMRYARGLLKASSALGPKGVQLLRRAVIAADAAPPQWSPPEHAEAHHEEVQALLHAMAPALVVPALHVAPHALTPHAPRRTPLTHGALHG